MSSDDDRVTTRVGATTPRPTSAQLVQGDVVSGRYRLERFLSRGGMGRVWQAMDLDLRRSVAIKLMHPALVSTDSARARFLREAQAAATLDHPNVVKVLDVKIDGDLGVPFLTMELLRGEDLSTRLERGPLSYAKTLVLMRDVCAAIAKAHALQSVHRDLKPANIFLVSGQDGIMAKVLDFGIVKSLRPGAEASGDSSLTTAGAALGTVSYMSPEQANDAQQVDHRADLWSLAVVIFECLTGKRAFRAKSRVELVAEVNEARVVPSNYADNLPRGFDAWFARATHRDIERRFKSVTQLLEEFEALADGDDSEDSNRERQSLPPPSRSWASDANQIDINELRALTFKNNIVNEFLDSSTKHFVVGSKGLGKTLLLTYKRSLLNETYQGGDGRKHAAVTFIPEGRPYLDLMSDLPTPSKAATELMSDLSSCKRMWSFGFRVAAISHHAAASSDESEELAAFPASIRKMLQGRKVEPTVVVKELLAQPRSKLEQLLDRGESFLEYKIRSLHSAVFMFVDKLDQALRQLPREAWIRMQAGMIEAAWDLMNTNAHVKIFATIREEAFAEYESDIKANLHGATTTLRYTKRDLKDMLEKLTYFYERVPLRDFVSVDIVSATGGARSEPPFDFIYRHTLGRPRDFVIISSEISRNRGAPLDQGLFTRVVRETAASLLVSNVFNEMRVFLEILRDRESRGRFLALLPHDILTHDELIDVWCEFHGLSREYYEVHGHDAEGVYHPFRELFDCGLLGVIVRDPQSGRRLQRFRQSRDAIVGSRRKLPSSPCYLIHPALQALVTQIAGGGDFVPFRHVIIGHGEAWPSYYGRLIDIQRELMRGAERDDADTEDLVFELLDRFDAYVGAGDSVDFARRLVSATELYDRLCARLERVGWDELHLALLELFPNDGRAEAQAQARAPAPALPAELAPGPRPAAPPAVQTSTLGASQSGAVITSDTTLGPTRRATVAMLLVDIVNSTGFIKEHGDTQFVEVLRWLRHLLTREGGEPALVIKGTGDGYLVIYETVTAALDGAAALRGGVEDPGRLRMIIHSGAVRLGANDVNGREATRLFRLEKLDEAARVGPAGEVRLPICGRALVSDAAIARLGPAQQAKFERVGSFRVKDFEEPTQIWAQRAET